MTRFVIKTLVCVLLAATEAQAGGITTANVKVRITGEGCGDLKDVVLVINGHDGKDRRVTLVRDPEFGPDERCRWKTDLGRSTISTTVATFSLRVGPIRTGCQRAGADEEKLFANVEFSYPVEGTFRNVNVKIVPPMQVSYVRYVHPTAEGREPIACREAATLVHGQGAISNATFDGEDVYFDFGAFDANRQRLGLLLNDIVVDDATLLLTRDGVVYRLIVQRAKGKVRSAPTLSSNAISLDITKLADLKFERAEFRVIK